jgi:hypothetical protein
MSAANIVSLDVTNSTAVWFGSQRLCAGSERPQHNAGRKLRELGIPGNVTIHFRRLGHVVRSVLLAKLLEEADA